MTLKIRSKNKNPVFSVTKKRDKHRAGKAWPLDELFEYRRC